MIRRGVTMVELLVGLTILSVTATIGTASLALLADRRERARDVGATVTREAALRRLLVQWIEGAHGSSGVPGASSGAFQLVDAETHGRGTDELLFATSAPTPLRVGDVTVRLYIDRDDTTPESGLTAEFRAWATGSTSRLELDPRIVELDIRCLSDLLGTKRWVTSWMSGTLLPRAVELQFGAARNDSLPPLLRLPIVAVIEGGR